METPRFVHLHLHTDYSLLDGACDLEEVVDEAARRKMPAVAVTDHGNLFAAESFYHGRWAMLWGGLNFRVPDPLVFKGPCLESTSRGEHSAVGDCPVHIGVCPILSD